MLLPISLVWLLLTLLLAGLAYVFLGINYEQSMRSAEMTLLGCLVLYFLFVIAYGWLKSNKMA